MNGLTFSKQVATTYVRDILFLVGRSRHALTANDGKGHSIARVSFKASISNIPHLTPFGISLTCIAFNFTDLAYYQNNVDKMNIRLINECFIH